MTEETKPTLEEYKKAFNELIGNNFISLMNSIKQLPVDHRELAPVFYSLQSSMFYLREFVDALVDLNASPKENPVEDAAPEANGDDKNPE